MSQRDNKGEEGVAEPLKFVLPVFAFMAVAASLPPSPDKHQTQSKEGDTLPITKANVNQVQPLTVAPTLTALVAPLFQPMQQPMMDLLHLMETRVPTTQQTPADVFRGLVDRIRIDADSWMTNPMFASHARLTHVPVEFPLLDHLDLSTHAKLVITEQPGPFYIPNANQVSDRFRIQLVPHPLMPNGALSSWKVSPLHMRTIVDGQHPNLTNSSAKKSTKKRRHSETTNASSSTPLVDPSQVQPLVKSKRKVRDMAFIYADYPFGEAGRLDLVIDDLVFQATGCRPMTVQFSCMAIDPLGRIHTFKVESNPLVVISNCNQWKEGLGICLRHLIFSSPSTTQVPFNRVFNYVQMACIATRGTDDYRYLSSVEIMVWLIDCCAMVVDNDPPIPKRDIDLLEKNDVVTKAVFDRWYEAAGPVLYDLHTCNVGKLFQKLWTSGFIGIGPYLFPDPYISVYGCFRLVIDTTRIVRDAQESYLVLQTSKRQYPLLALERDQLAYFLEHSRHSVGCTHLLSATSHGQSLVVDTVITKKPVGTPTTSFRMRGK
jgi:hypothetical protein